LVLGPAFLTIALAIKLSDNGPVFYKHRRLGRQARSFYCLKFRTMRLDSQAQLQLILSNDPAAAEEWRNTQKLRSDPRVTKLGAFLRKSSLDELPQLINVLRGEMSLIGPRPITPAELERYGNLRRYYLLVRPGITGLWQVSGRSSTSYASRIRFDREYLERWTWASELNILLRTVPAALRTTDSC
jgi:exopolysaccharide production protein ExoY